jgi:two-component system nitrogen regulation response regulator GlnG
MTGGNQLRAARLLGLNRNTLRKRCRELRLALPREPRRASGGRAAAPLAGG